MASPTDHTPEAIRTRPMLWWWVSRTVLGVIVAFTLWFGVIGVAYWAARPDDRSDERVDAQLPRVAEALEDLVADAGAAGVTQMTRSCNADRPAGATVFIDVDPADVAQTIQRLVESARSAGWRAPSAGASDADGTREVGGLPFELRVSAHSSQLGGHEIWVDARYLRDEAC